MLLALLAIILRRRGGGGRRESYATLLAGVISRHLATNPCHRVVTPLHRTPASSAAVYYRRKRPRKFLRREGQFVCDAVLSRDYVTAMIFLSGTRAILYGIRCAVVIRK